jgi:hypothetical protein
MSKVALLIDDENGAISVSVEPLDDNDTHSVAYKIACELNQMAAEVLKEVTAAIPQNTTH